MRRRFGRIRTLKWTGTVACGLLLLAAAAGLRWRWVDVYNDRHRIVRIDRGALTTFWTHESSGGIISRYAIGPNYDSWRESFRSYASGSWPALESIGPRAWILVTPLWIPFVLIGVPTALLWRLDRRRAAPGRCRKCNYDLTGNLSGRCPECGTPVERPK